MRRHQRYGVDLGVKAMAVYCHVRKDHLLDLVIEGVMRDTEPPVLVGDWRVDVMAIARTARAGSRRHRRAVSLGQSRPWVGPAGLAALDGSLAVFREAGFDDRAAVFAQFALGNYVSGFMAGYQPSRRQARHPLGAQLRRIGFAISPPRPAGFTSEAGRAAYEAVYHDAVDALWPVPVESTFTNTRYGTTHALVSGPADGPPLVLLHGAGLSAVSWYTNAARLAAVHRIFALDSVFDAGLGRQTGLIRGRRDVARWLMEVIDGLGLTRPAVAGLSQGAWVAASLARFEPDTISRAALLAPAATLQPFRLPVAMMARYGYLLPRGDPVANARRTFDMVFGDRFAPDQRFVRLAASALPHFRYARPPVFPTVFSDEDLAAIDVPLLVLLPAKEVIYDPAKAFERVRRVMPDAEAEMVPDAGHFVAMEAAERVSARLLAFFGAQQARGARSRA